MALNLDKDSMPRVLGAQLVLPSSKSQQLGDDAVLMFVWLQRNSSEQPQHEPQHEKNASGGTLSIDRSDVLSMDLQEYAAALNRS